MPPAPKSKQQSLSRFFSPKTTKTTKFNTAQKTPSPKKHTTPVKELQNPKKRAAASAPGSTGSAKKPKKAEEAKTKRKKRVVTSDEERSDEELGTSPASPAETKADPSAMRDENSPPSSLQSSKQSTTGGGETVFVSDKKVHAKYVKKFANTPLGDESSADSSQDAGLFFSAEAAASSKKALATQSKGKKVKFTPLETQVMAIKKENPDVVLFVEVGYKYRFFGEDAKLAAKLLDIYLNHSNNFLTASIPTFRLNIHMTRLVEAGYKVGIVRQTETAAIKKHEKSAGPFERKLTEMYTKATMLPEVHGAESGSFNSATPQRFLVMFFEQASTTSSSKTNSSSSKAAGSSNLAHVEVRDAVEVNVAMLAVDCANGEVVWDYFKDGLMRANLETRLTRLQPDEVLLPFDPASGQHLCSKLTSKVLKGYCANAIGGKQPRLEEVNIKKHPFVYAAATSTIARFYENSSSSSSSSSKQDDNSAKIFQVLKLPEAVVVCVGVFIAYLSDFKLEGVFDQVDCFRSFGDKGCMEIDGITMYNLEIFANEDQQVHGSLLWLLAHAKTAAGSRQLHSWVSRPLVDRAAIEARLDAVEEIARGGCVWIDSVYAALCQMPDLERAMSRIRYLKCRPSEFVTTLDAFGKLAKSWPRAGRLHPPVQSALLLSTFAQVDVDELQSVVSGLLSALHKPSLLAYDKAKDHEKAACKVAFFSDLTHHPAIAQCKQDLARVEADLQKHLQTARATLCKLDSGYSSLPFKSVSGAEFLVEVKAKHKKNVPADWESVNATKAAVRMHPPYIKRAYEQLQLHREELASAVEEAWHTTLQAFTKQHSLFRQAVRALSHIDCLFALAVVAGKEGYTRPRFCDKHVLRATNLRHAMVEAVKDSETFVPNSIHLQEDGERFMVITGPNMGGKSSYIRSVAVMVAMAQIGSFVPCDQCEMGVFDAIYTRMGARDSASTGQSTFLVELGETSNILRQATSRSLVVLDELGRGTSTHDGVAIAAATMEHVIDKIGCFTLFVTHYPLLGRRVADFGGKAGNYHMSFVEDGDSQNITFLYTLVKGLCSNSYGLNVARLADIPQQVIDIAALKAEQLRCFIEQTDCAGDAQTGTASDPSTELSSKVPLAGAVQQLQKLIGLIESKEPVALEELQTLQQAI